MRFKSLILMTLAVAIGSGGVARAQTISYQYITDSSAYYTTAGSPVTVNLYLQETIVGGKGAGSSLINSANGLQSAGVAVQAVGSQSATTITGISQNFAAIASGGFGTAGGTSSTYAPGGPGQANLTQVTGSAAAMTVGTGFTPSSGPQATNILFNSPGGNTVTLQVLLGTLTITPTAVATTTTNTYQITSLGTATAPQMATDLGSMYTVTYPDSNLNVYNLDSTNNAAYGGGATYIGADNSALQFTVTVTAAAVPEPSSMLLCGLAAFGGALGYYRRRKAQSKEPAANA